jgi:general secretion pathway protein F
MPRFRYSAVDGNGRRIEGVLDSQSSGAVLESIRSRGHLPLRIEPDAADGLLRALLTTDLLGGPRLPVRRIVEMTRELAMLLEAGQSLDQALQFVIRVTRHKPARQVLIRVRERVRGGSGLGGALAQEPGSFSRLYVGLVRAGEQSGTLGPTLAHLATLLEGQQTMRAKARSALIYPVLLITASLATVALILLYILPQFAPLFAEAGRELPRSMTFLLRVGDLIERHGISVLALSAAAMVIGGFALRRPSVKLTLDRQLLRLPVIGRLIRMVETARLMRTLGTLLASDVPLVAGLGIGRTVVGNGVFAGMVDRAIAAVKDGAKLAPTLEAARLLPPRAIQLLELGDETGQLGAMTLRAAEIHEAELGRELEQIVAMIVPATTIFLGLVVGAIITTLLSAMLSLNQLAG